MASKPAAKENVNVLLTPEKDSKREMTTPEKSQKIIGYVTSVTSVTPSKDKKRKLFNFKVASEEIEHSFVCFSPEKHRFVSNLADQKSDAFGCEITQFKHPNISGGNLIIGDYTKIKRARLEYKYQEHDPEFVTLLQVNNECSLHEEVCVKGTITDINDPIKRTTQYGDLTFTEAFLSDGTDSIKLSLKNEYGLQVQLNQSYSFKNMKVAKYMTTRLLKTQETTRIMALDDNDEDINSMDVIPSSQTSKQGIVISVNMVTLRITFACSKCNEILQEPREEFIICHHCNNMVLADDCKKDKDVEFTLKSDSVNVTIKCKRTILESIFAKDEEGYADLDNTQKNIIIASKMMRKKIEVKYDTSCDEVTTLVLI